MLVGRAGGATVAGRASVAVGNGSATLVAPKVAVDCAGTVGSAVGLVTACAPPQLLSSAPSTAAIPRDAILISIKIVSLYQSATVQETMTTIDCREYRRST